MSLQEWFATKKKIAIAVDKAGLKATAVELRKFFHVATKLLKGVFQSIIRVWLILCRWHLGFKS